MSFGFSVGDIIVLTQLTTRTYNRWKKACGEYASITCDLAVLKTLLERVEVEAKAPDSLLTRKKNDIECWRTLSKSCQSLVVELEDILKKYEGLGTSRSRSRRKNWERIRKIFDDDLDNLGKEVEKRIGSLNAFITGLGMGSQSRVENGIFPKLLERMDHIAEQMRNGNASSNTALTTYENDDKAVWRDFRREMISAGIRSSDICQYSVALKTYLARLQREGLLDEKKPPKKSINSAGAQTPASESSTISITPPSQGFSFGSANRSTSPPIRNTPLCGGRQGLLSPEQSSGFSSTASFSPEGFHLNRPSDDRIIEQEFVNLMTKRGWKSLPKLARRQLEAYPTTKKWTLIYRDKLAEFQNELNAGQNIRGTDALGIPGKAAEKGSPEWSVLKLMENRITSKELQSLDLSLRTQPLAWTETFVDAQGQIALSNALSKINRQQGQGLALLPGSFAEKDPDREYNIIKCLRESINHKYGADNAIAHPQIVTALAGSLISPRLRNRKLISEIMTFLSYWADGQGHSKVISALDWLKSQQGENERFDAWMRIVEVTIDTRGKMGGLDLDSVRSSGIGMENLLMEYIIMSLFLVNMIVDTPKDIRMRVHLRVQFKRAGIQRLLTKMGGFQYEVIEKQIAKYRNNESIDNEDLLKKENSGKIAEIAENTAGA